MLPLAVPCLLLLVSLSRGQEIGHPELVYEWKYLELDWPSPLHKEQALANQTFIPARNMVAGIKLYNNHIYLTIPRWFWTSGHPVTLAKVITTKDQVKLTPYPNWASQKQGDCNSLQYVQGMEIDPNTGLMYVIDTGRPASRLDLCPAKLVIYDLKTDSLHQKFDLPADVVNPHSNFLNDLVLDYVGGKVRFVYITDANDARLIVFDLQAKKAFYIKDKSMETEPGAEVLTINGKSYNIPVALDGIAMSPEFDYIYYCSLAGFTLYQLPTASLRLGKTAGLRPVGRKLSQSGGIGYGSKHLFYGAFGLNAVYFWDSQKDMASQKRNMDTVTLQTQKELVRNDSSMQWPDTLAFDNRGWLWFVSNRLQEFRELQGLPEGGEPYMRLWKVWVNETGYLYQADRRTQFTYVQEGDSACSLGWSLALFLTTCSLVVNDLM